MQLNTQKKMAKSIANMNNAEIKLESKQGKGSTFTLIFFRKSN